MGVEQYIADHGVDPTPCLQTPYMSEAISHDSDYNDHQQVMRTRARVTEADIEQGIQVLEHRSLGWRSGKVRKHLLSRAT